jgi:hypothetical protein
VIQPTNPQLVYVPQFNPTVVYGTPVPRPDYSTAAVVTTALLAFGAGIAVGAAINNSCCGWGYSYWDCNWHGGAVVYKSNVYYGNAAWHGGVYGTSVIAYGPYGAARAGTAYNPSTGTYARGATVATPYMALEVPEKPITRTREHTRAAYRGLGPMEPQPRDRHTTRTPALMPLPTKSPTSMALREARSYRRTDRLHTPNIRPQRKGQSAR